MRVLLLLACLCWSLPVQAQTPNPYPFTGGDPVIADWLLLAFAVPATHWMPLPSPPTPGENR